MNLKECRDLAITARSQGGLLDHREQRGVAAGTSATTVGHYWLRWDSGDGLQRVGSCHWT